MKSFLLCALISTLAIPSFAKQGSEGLGGGDICEDRIKDIRQDLASWIERGGHTDLKFTGYQTAELYKNAMLTQIAAAKVQCISQGHTEYPIKVIGVPKVCKFNFSSAGSFITCERKAFLELDESAQYTLIHHEYAGLSQMEIPSGSDSNYQLSNQISSYLEARVVKYLAVKKYEAPYEMSSICTAEAILGNTIAGQKSFKLLNARSPNEKAALFANELNRAEVGPFMVALEVNPFGTISTGLFRQSESLARKILKPSRRLDHFVDAKSPYLTNGGSFLRTYRKGDESFTLRCEETSSNLKKPAEPKPLRVQCTLDVFVDGIYNNPSDRITVPSNSTGSLAVAGFKLDVQTTGPGLSATLTDAKNGQTTELSTNYLPPGTEEELRFMNTPGVFRMKASCKAE